MNNTISKTKKPLLAGLLIAAITISLNLSFSGEDQKNDSPMQTIETISIATKMIQDKKYDEATELLSSINNVDFYFLKNQHLGDISFLNKKYDEALSFYNVAQAHAKDKVMHEYMSKKMAYITTVKKGAVEKEEVINDIEVDVETE